MTFSSEIMKNNVSTNAICDVLHVQWSLLSTCNYSCSYCSVPRGDENCIFVRERLLSMAHKILELPRSRYVITFTGGEPTLHPHLHELIHYLYSSRRDVHIIIETNGSCEIDYFMPLLNAAPNHTLQINISVHVAFAELPQILTLIAVISDAHQLAHVKLMFDPTCREQVETFCAALTKLRGVVPFTMCIELLMLPSDMSQTDPLYTEADLHWRDMAQRYFAQAAATGPAGHQIAATLPPASEPVSLGFKDFYCCVGTNVLRIDADGRFYSSTCSMVRNNPPLWRATSEDIEGISYVVKCRAECCAGGINLVLPKFRKLEDAEAYMAAMKQRALELDFQSPPLPNPLRTEPSTKDIVKSRLKRLEPATSRTIESESEPALQQPNPVFIIKHMADICKVYETISDENSRDTFLRDLKVIMTGDASYHKEATYARFTHDKVQEECGDIIADGGKRYCTLFRLEGGDVFARLQAARGAIRQHQPKVQIALLRDTESYIETFLWFLEHFPQYTLYIGYHADHPDETCLYGLPPVLPRKRHLPIPDNIPLPLVSIIVPTHNNEDTLKRCIDSALIQRVDDIEIIIVDDASTDKTPEIIAEYVRRYPKIVRTVRFSENKGAGPARNSGMDMALGKYMAFIDSDDMLATDFLRRGLEVMETEQADIVAFDMVINRGSNKQEELWNVEPGIWAGEESLCQLLLRKFGNYGTCSRLYRSSMITTYNVYYGEMSVHEDIFFNVKAFFYSQKTVVLPCVGYYIYARKGSLSISVNNVSCLDSFIKIVSFITHFFEDHNIDTESEMYKYCIRQIYTWDRERSFAAISQAEKENYILDLLTEERLLALGESKEALCCILTDYAILHCHRNNLHPKVAPKDLDWRAAAASPRPPKTHTAYGYAENPTTLAPLLSVIIPNYNKENSLIRCLDSIFNQSMQNFEVIIVDDASTDGSYEILMNYADMFKSVRLYKMDYNCGQSVCQNIGIEKLLGEYIVFVDSDDWCDKDFFRTAIEIIRKSCSDVVAFSSKCTDEEGKTLWCSKPIKSCSSGKIALQNYLKGELFPQGGAYAKIFDTNFIKNCKLNFKTGIYHQDHHFLGDVLLQAKRITSDAYVAYNIVMSNDSSIRPASYRYQHANSAYQFYRYIQNISMQAFSGGDIYKEVGTLQSLWNMENIFLHACAAFWRSTGGVPMTVADHALLQSTPLFVWTMLVGYARCRTKGNIPQDLLPAVTQCLTKESTNTVSDAPLVSVIIPSYNQEACISRCLDSVLGQSLRNIEVIVINDASTDKTLALCEAYAKKDPRVRVYSNEVNSGQGYSRNRALNLSSGKYITYVDSDDYVLDNFFLEGVVLLEMNTDIDLIHFSYMNVEQSGKLINKCIDRNRVVRGEDILLEYLEGNSKSWGPVAKIIRKDLLVRNSITYEHFIFEDNVFLLYLKFFAKAMAYTESIGYVVVKTPHLASVVNPTQISPRHITGWIALPQSTEAFFKKHHSATLTEEYSKKRCVQWFKHKTPRLLSYIATFSGKAISPFTDDDMATLKNAKSFFAAILEDYARLHALHTNYTPILPPEDLDPHYTHPVPANSLVFMPFSENTEPVILSVIIPAYNVAPYLARCLDSVLEQNVEGVEIILVEDCSPNDATLAICEQYARKHDSIRLFRTPWNSGLGTVRNLAMRHARGKYITFVDSDDWLAHGFIQRGLEQMEQNPEVDLIDFSSCAWDDVKNEPMHYRIKPDNMRMNAQEALNQYICGTFHDVAAWAKIYRSSFLLEKQIYFGVEYNEDEMFLLKVYKRIHSMSFSDILAYYYVRNALTPSIMHPCCRGKRYFESTLGNIRLVHELLSTVFAEGEDSLLYKTRISSYRWGHHRDNLLYYIHACHELGLPSPLTDDALETLTLSTEFMRNLLMDYAVLSQKPLPQKKGS